MLGRLAQNVFDWRDCRPKGQRAAFSGFIHAQTESISQIGVADMNPISEELIAPCGMNCAVCSRYLAYLNDLY